MSQEFCNILLVHTISWPKQFKLCKVLAVGDSIMVVGTLTFSALLYSTCDLKTEQMNIQSGLIQELILYKFKLGYKATEATENICFAKSEYSNQMVLEILLGLQEPWWSGKVR